MELDANKVELHAAETLLQRGIQVFVKAPLFLRLFGKKRIKIRLGVPTAGALHRMGYWYLHCQLPAETKEGVSLEQALLFKVKYGRFIYRAIACLFLVGKWRTALFMKPVARWLEENMTVNDALTLLQLVILQGGLEDFMTTTRLVRAKMITSPRLGQTTKRS
ncbi:hypothetical protein [Sphingobacterium thalpophilum]|uniref:hypothetical protein n=1 Tax=Sphingobacterium thalpophilum TaxID=259 RepID=UPI0024A68C19|nr:hypothetical protein [Sphingobacterium thalpophilum]